MVDPWSINYFNPPAPNVQAPPSRPKVPKPIPDVDRLFQVQRNALKALNELEDVLAGAEGHQRHKLQSLQRDVENTYRVIRSYLNEHANDQAL